MFLTFCLDHNFCLPIWYIDARSAFILQILSLLLKQGRRMSSPTAKNHLSASCSHWDLLEVKIDLFIFWLTLSTVQWTAKLRNNYRAPGAMHYICILDYFKHFSSFFGAVFHQISSTPAGNLYLSGTFHLCL